MNRSIIVIFAVFFCIKICSADTCPLADELGMFHTPPPGWSLLVGAPPGDDYVFGEAVHSLNGGFYYKQVICKYEECPSDFCPAFALLSDNTYELPNSSFPPWHSHSSIKSTLTCRPPDHNPGICVFQ